MERVIPERIGPHRVWFYTGVSKRGFHLTGAKRLYDAVGQVRREIAVTPNEATMDAASLVFNICSGPQQGV
jgi:hypothetical protein